MLLTLMSMKPSPCGHLLLHYFYLLLILLRSMKCFVKENQQEVEGAFYSSILFCDYVYIFSQTIRTLLHLSIFGRCVFHWDQWKCIKTHIALCIADLNTLKAYICTQWCTCVLMPFNQFKWNACGKKGYVWNGAQSGFLYACEKFQLLVRCN